MPSLMQNTMLKSRFTNIIIAVAATCIASLWGCSGQKSGAGKTKPVLAVSIEPQRKMLEELVGDRFDVFAVMPSGANPETYDPPMSARARMAEAKAYFIVGHLPFERALAGDIPVVDTSVGIMPITGTHGHSDEDDDHDHEHEFEHDHDHGDVDPNDCVIDLADDHGHHHDHGDVDPHVWTSLRNAKYMAYTMMASLIKADPDNAYQYRENFNRMACRYDSLDAVVTDRLARSGAKAFAVWHPSLSYFARDYGLSQISVGQESKEMPLGRLKATIDRAKADSVSVFFFQKEFDSRQAENTNREIGSRLVSIDPLAYDWESQLMLVADELSK